MSPEQARGSKVDARSDIFSLGAVLYEMLEGRAPFQGLTASDLIVAILSSEPPPLTRLAQSVDLQKIVSKALNKDIDQRYQTAGALASDLKALNKPSDADPATIAATGTTVHVSEEQQAATRNAETVGRIDKLKAAPVVSTTHALEATSRRHKLTIIFALAILIGLAAYFGRTLTRQASKDPNGKIKLAILPFHSVNAPEEVRFLGLGISDAIITRLANVKRMRIRPTSAILRYENQNVDEREAGRTLETDYVLSGTVISAGDRLSVRVQLIQVSDGTPLWGSHYEVARQDLIGLQDSMAERISEALKLHLSAEEQAQVYRRYTDNVAAYEAYLQGRTDLSRYTKEATFAAVSAFETALRFDSNYALADAGLAMASAQISIRFAPATDVKMWADRATSEARRALQLEPNLAEAHEALAAVYRNTEFDWERTIEQSNRALEINPSLEFPHYYRAAAFYHLGVFDAIEREVVLGLEINPLNRAEPLRVRGTAALFGGKFGDAVSFLEEAKRQSENTVIDWYLAQAYYYEGRKALGEEVLAGLRGSAQAEHRAKATLASFLAARGAREEARKLLREVISGSYMDHHVAYALGAAYTQLGDFDNAKKWLAQASQTGLPCYPWFERDPLLERLRADVEFQQFLGRMRDLWETAKSRYRAG
jgi:serine/threonine-protein kinase